MISSDGQEVRNFVCACEDIHALLTHEPLAPDDRDLIEISCIDLLSKLRPDYNRSAWAHSR